MHQSAGNLCKVLIAIERRKDANRFLKPMQLIGQQQNSGKYRQRWRLKALVVECNSHSVREPESSGDPAPLSAGKGRCQLVAGDEAIRIGVLQDKIRMFQREFDWRGRHIGVRAFDVGVGCVGHEADVGNQIHIGRNL